MQFPTMYSINCAWFHIKNMNMLITNNFTIMYLIRISKSKYGNNILHGDKILQIRIRFTFESFSSLVIISLTMLNVSLLVISSMFSCIESQIFMSSDIVLDFHIISDQLITVYLYLLYCQSLFTVLSARMFSFSN